MSSLKTYLLLGNHEIDSNEHNILEAFEFSDSNYIPVTKMTKHSGILFIPYNVDLESLDKEIFKDKIIITHHDIYGSVLAGGKVRASFGYDPNMFNEAEIVFNGHVHLRSEIGKVNNIGSLLTSQFGELKEGCYDFPRYYIYDTETKTLKDYMNDQSLFYLTVNSEDIYKLESNNYSKFNIVLRVNYKYDNEISEINFPKNVLKVNKRKLIDTNVNTEDKVIRSSNIDIKSMISSYILKDPLVLDSDKDRLISKCLEVLGG